MVEVWKDIEGYEGFYQVSTLGNVKSLNYRHTGKEKILRPLLKTNGYLSVELCKDGKRKHYLIHRLVAEAFIPNPFKLPCVNHKSGNKQENFVENLEWCTQQYNTEYSWAKPVYCIELDKVFHSSMEAYRQTGINISNIIQCCKGKRKSARKFHWQYAEK